MPATLITYQPRHQRAVLNFVRQQRHVQQHLDWRPIQEWLRDEQEFIFLAIDGASIIGTLAFARPLGDVAWLRLVGVSNNCGWEVIEPIFRLAVPTLTAAGARRVLLLEMAEWIEPLLRQNNFYRIDHLVHLQRLPKPFTAPPTHTKIYRANRHHIAAVVPIDHAAFAAPWQMSEADFKFAMSYTSYFTIAMRDQTPVGYQLSTSYHDGIHLARLAVLPAYSGQGIGSQLVSDLIKQFPRQGITVNTQSTNQSAIHLYERLGFEHEAFVTPVWEKRLG